ncbi:leucine efflux protein LeuE [Phytoactinopolyspora halotolerans]|uniref:Leucine efflux protein LeuE n=1 Tax=Phytoactinopolyspora halotolerans TaxID=1981512 RepID=A0A6L9S554_9ACTN|nr:leucine efflux protein LeuE [Phytoactinopolyspora halotolerans]NEE00123.1 leucine efflux protein LeuE [Phytoactinopolyspora halotolerans]
MLGITDLSTYLVGLALVILMPGPNSLYVLSVAARRGVRAAYQAAAGVFCGDATLMFLSAAGAASVLKASPLAFSIVKLLGAGYLTWLAIGMLRGALAIWRQRTTTSDVDDVTDPARARDGAPVTGTSDDHAPGKPVHGGVRSAGLLARPAERPFRRALIASLLNPKAILFFVAFFVQFVDPAYPYPALSFLILGAWVQLFSVTYLSILIFSGSRLADAFRRRRRLRAGSSAAAGGAFLGFAVKLSLASPS